MVVVAVKTCRYARAGSLSIQRAWALGLFALAIGSWLYRMDYGFWLLLGGGRGHTHDFHGPFDHVMAFFFYLPNLLIVEAFIRAQSAASPKVRLAAAGLFPRATGLFLLRTYSFTKLFPGPANPPTPGGGKITGAVL